MGKIIQSYLITAYLFPCLYHLALNWTKMKNTSVKDSSKLVNWCFRRLHLTNWFLAPLRNKIRTCKCLCWVYAEVILILPLVAINSSSNTKIRILLVFLFSFVLFYTSFICYLFRSSLLIDFREILLPPSAFFEISLCSFMSFHLSSTTFIL